MSCGPGTLNAITGIAARLPAYSLRQMRTFRYWTGMDNHATCAGHVVAGEP
jgi:hypothetical protein